MHISGYKHRVVDDQIEQYLRIFGAVCLEGPKWCGKTWAGMRHANSMFNLADPAGNFANKALAETEIESAFIGKRPHLIDEWQEIPRIWDAVRMEVDKTPEKGQFILTGSSTPRRKGILHSGTGRIAGIRMRTMSLFETGDSAGAISLRELCGGRLQMTLCEKPASLESLADRIVRGGWPDTLHITAGAERIAAEYLHSTVESIPELDDNNRVNLNRIRMLLRSLARNESTSASITTLRKDISGMDGWDMRPETVKKYLDIFERLFLTEDLEPFSVTLRSPIRLKQSVKRHFADTSLTCALLEADPGRLMRDLRTFGLLFEALCVHDLRVYSEAFEGQLYHYQDYKDHEFDAVIRLPGGDWCAFEIKLGANQVDEAAGRMRDIASYIGKKHAPSVLCVLCGTANAAYVRKDGVFVVPITLLGP